MSDRGTSPLRLLVFGMACAASAAPLAALLDAGFEVVALVLPGGEPSPPCPLSRASGEGGNTHDRVLPCFALGDSGPSPRAGGPEGGGHPLGPDAVDRGDPEHLAAVAGVPVLHAAMDNRRLLALASAVDAVVVACFPWKLPPALLARPRLGGLNVHPSLLPLGRGPEPVFWTLRRGEQTTGATVHRLDGGWDTGPVVAQRAVDVPVGVRGPALERDLMALGGELLVETLPQLASGRLVPVPQDDAGATRAPVPAAADWLVPTDLPAGWTYAFARGVAPLGGPLAVRGPFGVVPVRDAVAHDPMERPADPIETKPGGNLRVRFSRGWVEFAPG